jgi:hypothetical protein
MQAGGSPGTWYLRGQSGLVRRGVPGGESSIDPGDVGLLGYDPFAIAAACDALGWERTLR